MNKIVKVIKDAFVVMDDYGEIPEMPSMYESWNNARENAIANSIKTLPEHKDFWYNIRNCHAKQGVDYELKNLGNDNATAFSQYAVPIDKLKTAEDERWEQFKELIIPCIGTFNNALVEGIAQDITNKAREHFTISKKIK